MKLRAEDVQAELEAWDAIPSDVSDEVQPYAAVFAAAREWLAQGANLKVWRCRWCGRKVNGVWGWFHRERTCDQRPSKETK